jgi:hypothetical protein
LNRKTILIAARDGRQNVPKTFAKIAWIRKGAALLAPLQTKPEALPGCVAALRYVAD